MQHLLFGRVRLSRNRARARPLFCQTGNRSYPHVRRHFRHLKEDHETHRKLLDKMAETSGETERRKKLLEEFTKEVKSHASAEEQALYSTMLRKPPTTDDTRHSVAEHHELEETLNDLAATDMSSSAWMAKFKQLDHDYRHHINEEEEDHFPDFEQHLTKDDRAHMDAVFERRKAEEKSRGASDARGQGRREEVARFRGGQFIGRKQKPARGNQ